MAAQQENPYRSMEYNQLALQLFQMGFFRPELASQARQCLSLMDFRRKDALAALLEETAAAAADTEKMRREMLTLAAIVDDAKGSHLQEKLAAEFAAADGQAAAGGKGAAAGGKRSIMDKARQAARDVVSPR